MTASGGCGPGDLQVARFNPDEGIGTGGLVATDFGGVDYGEAHVLQPAGKLLATRLLRHLAGPPVEDLALARYTADGALDRSSAKAAGCSRTSGRTTSRPAR